MNNSPIEAIKSNGFNDGYANFKLNSFNEVFEVFNKEKEKGVHPRQSAFLALKNNPDGQVYDVTLSNGAPNSIMT